MDKGYQGAQKSVRTIIPIKIKANWLVSNSCPEGQELSGWKGSSYCGEFLRKTDLVVGFIRHTI